MAEKIEHTPGPWRVEEGTTLVWGACNPEDLTTYGMGYPIIECRISPVSMWADTKGPTADEGEANARLVAAAPDLLAALNGVMHLLDGQAWELARAAISKVEGRS